MKVTYGLPQDKPAAVVTVGTFDGVHRGHQQLLSRVSDEAQKAACQSAVLTFDPHPRCVVEPHACPPLITTVEERLSRFRWHGMDLVSILAFTPEFSEKSAEEFCNSLREAFDLHGLVVGDNFAMGHKRQGTVKFLRDYAASHDIKLHVVKLSSATEADGKPSLAISSSHVRDLIRAGQIEAANDLLSYPYFMDGIIEHGDRLGEVLGFPTANLAFPDTKCIPGMGIYAGWTNVSGHWHPTAISVGVRPTFGGDTVHVEGHILDFDRDIYHRRVRLAFQSRIRDEVRFVDRRSLIAQMRQDTAAVKAHLADLPLPTIPE